MKTLAWICGLAVIASASWAWADAAGSQTRAAALTAYNQGNFKDAYEDYRRLTLDRQADPSLVGADLNMAVLCLQRLGRVEAIDGLLEDAVRVHQDNWRLLCSAAQNYARIPHQGLIVAGEFQRGERRGDGKQVNAVDRDRARALQLMVQAMPLVLADEHRDEASGFFLTLAGLLQDNRGAQAAWRLQSLTDLKQLPDYEESFGFFVRSGSAAPVDADGAPVFYTVPKSFDAARNDGQRWRWCLQEAVELDPQKADAVRMQFAEFLWNQFGVQTMASMGWRNDASRKDESGVYAVSTLKDTETIARLATGVRRFTLPEEFNYIAIFRQVADRPQSPQAVNALERLARIYENRRQYTEAAGYWRRLLDQYPDERGNRRLSWRRRLDQIVGNWGRFEPTGTQPAGRGATVDYRFRNGRSVELTAHEINIEKLLGDVKAFLKSNPRSLDWQKIDISNLGYRLVVQNQRQYVGRRPAQWRMALEPREGHCDRRVTVTTPLSRPGAYLVEARMEDGNTSSIVVWIDDTAIVKKPLENKVLYFVADAVTGAPVAKANVEFFGWRQNFLDQPPRREIVTRQFAERTDSNGQAIPDPKQHDTAYQWLVTARTRDGRLAYMGFNNIWFGDWRESPYNEVKVYTITDRPVYRPEQKVQYKLWVRRARYDLGEDSEFADRPLTIKLYDAKGDEVASEQVRSDRYGGVSGQFAIAADASLGEYQIQCRNEQADILGGGGFRVEEYKKPEYEVTVDAPAKPVALGGTITATIRAKYYFGSPVTNARVKYKVERTPHTERWYPLGPWDWLYEPGYGWCGCDYTWYPGWASWGCPRPRPFWIPFRPERPELVAEQQTTIGPDGTVRVAIDTATAKLLHPDQDQSYTITAEVVDASRRTIVGTGTVLVARRPFTIYAWLDRGYYRTGDPAVARFTARTLDGKPVQGQGEATLVRVTYQDGRPVETPVQCWKLATDPNGEARQPFSASQAGQYRIVYRLAASLADGGRATKDDFIEGGSVFTVRGEGFADGSQFRFNHLELVPDRREYAPGDKVRLQINVDRVGGTVLLFVRPSNGVYLPPKLLRIEGKSAIEEIDVTPKDMPNFFVEAVTVSDGRVYVETRQIVVPPESRVTNVAVEPSKESYRPGEKAGVKIRLTDLNGRPVTGSTVVAIYDKSVEYISGGSNVPDIRAFFWKWRRTHHPTMENSLQRWFQNLVPPKTIGMGNLGVFGGSVADDQSERRLDESNSVVRESGDALGVVRQEGMTLGVPMSAAAPSMALMDGGMGGVKMKAAPKADSANVAAEPAVRTKFADTALWVGALSTDASGAAHVGLEMPENLTTWRIKVWSMSQGTRVGQGQADVVTRKDLMIRMEAPRFFVQTDEVVLSAIVHNYRKNKQDVRVSLELGDRSAGPKTPGPLKLLDPQKTSQNVEIPSGGEARVDWPVRVLDEGQAVLRMKAVADEESDAMEQRIPCYVHGMFRTESFSESIRPSDERGQFTFNVPKDRRSEHSRLEVRWSPSLAAAMVDALPYLVDYPYGCTEQTLNRFLPTVVTQKALLDMKLDLKQIERKRTNLDAQQTGDGRQQAARWGLPTAKRSERNPVFDAEEVQRMVKHGVERLGAMQCADGGWGWFSGFGEHSSPHTTALVVHGLQVAQQSDVALTPGLLERGVEWLKRYQDKQIQLLKNAAVEDKPEDLRWKPSADNLDAMVYGTLVDADVKNDEMLEFLYRDRSKLAVYAMTMFGVALEQQGERDKLAMVLRNLGQFVEQDDENQTAWLRTPEDAWWYWYGSPIEANAYYLKLLARTDPKGELARRLVKSLLNNRKNATYWNSTRDTALCIEAMAEFLRASGEMRPSMTVEVFYDGKSQKTLEIGEKTLFDADNRFALDGDRLTTGRHTVELRKKGDGPLYCNGYLTTFTLEEFIRKAGLEIKVDRKYYKLVKVDRTVEVAGGRGQSIDQRVEQYERQPLPSGAEVRSGDLIEIELTIDSKNDYEYLVFEDMKPAGFEPVDVRSGYTGNELGAYVEFRDNRVAFFVERLARGRHSVSYRMRAEIPGRFSALPTRASAMYAPELKGNSDEMKVGIEE
ncbi:MAG: MG2 domain-containing protein [Thermoguttaceae bacterium]